MGALGAVVGKHDRIGRCFSRRRVELRIEDPCTGTEGRSDVDGLYGAEDESGGSGEEDQAVGGRERKKDICGHVRFTLLALSAPLQRVPSVSYMEQDHENRLAHGSS